MTLHVMRPDEVPRNWDWMAQLLRPALKHDRRSMSELRYELGTGRLGTMTVHEPGLAAVIIVATGRMPGDTVAWFKFVGGKSTLGPKAFVRTVRRIAFELEMHARRAGCTEMRYGGRAWSFLPGYEPYSKEHPHWMRKRLTDG